MSGMRRSELLGLRWSDIDFDRATGSETVAFADVRAQLGAWRQVHWRRIVDPNLLKIMMAVLTALTPEDA